VIRQTAKLSEAFPKLNGRPRKQHAYERAVDIIFDCFVFARGHNSMVRVTSIS